METKLTGCDERRVGAEEGIEDETAFVGKGLDERY
jgi:hypothetical protein